MTRIDGRADNELRPITFERDYTEMAAGSVLVTFGRTRVLCTASIDENVPRWMKNTGKGWVTAEYSMLPGASPERIDREAAKGKQSGRTVEIQRLIGRSLRAACDMQLLGERQVVVDCDVLQADGGTRTASICGGYLALHDALDAAGAEQGDQRASAALVLRGDQRRHRRRRAGARPAVRGGLAAEVDMNVVMLGKPGGEPRFVEVQGTAEGAAFSRGELDCCWACVRRAVGDHGVAGGDGLGAAAAASARPVTDGATACWSVPRPIPTRSSRSRRSSAEWSTCCRDRPTYPTSSRMPTRLIGNARLKAQAICAATGLPAVSDDTGLFVDALGGAPGVYAARFAGEDATYADNRAKLLRELGGSRPTGRPASCRW